MKLIDVEVPSIRTVTITRYIRSTTHRPTIKLLPRPNESRRKTKTNHNHHEQASPPQYYQQESITNWARQFPLNQSIAVSISPSSSSSFSRAHTHISTQNGRPRLPQWQQQQQPHLPPARPHQWDPENNPDNGRRGSLRFYGAEYPAEKKCWTNGCFHSYRQDDRDVWYGPCIPFLFFSCLQPGKR